MSTDRRVEIPREDWPKLRDLYTPNNSRSYIAFTALENYIRWIDIDPNIKHVKIYSLNGDFSDGTFAIIDRYCAYVDTFDESIENLRRLLRVLDFSKGLWFMSERSKIKPLIYDVIEEKGLTIPANGVIPLQLFRLRKEKALEYEITSKAGVELRPLSTNTDLETANAVWSFKSPNTIPFFERMVKYNASVGAYDENDNLISWILRFPTGLLAHLYTDKNHHGKGLASFVTRKLSKTIAELGHDSFAAVLSTNAPSLNLFNKLGFEPYDEIDWISTEISWNASDE